MGLKDECDAALEANLRTNKDDVTIKSDELDAVRPEIPVKADEGVTKFLMVLLEGLIALG